jgi:transposase
MPHYVGLDVSKNVTAICVLDAAGATVEERVVPTEPQAIADCLRGKRRRYRHVGLESGAIATWLQGELLKKKLPAVLIETRQAHGALKLRVNKTDRNDARGIADLMRTGSFRPVHTKGAGARGLKSLLTVRKLLVQKQVDIEGGVKGVLLLFGLKLGLKTRRYEPKVRALLKQDPAVSALVEPLLAARAAIAEQVTALTKRATELAKKDLVCRRLMTAPGVGVLTALEYCAAIDSPARFARSRSVGPHLGLTPRTFESGQTKRRGHISKWGDAAVRTALFLAARIILFTSKRESQIRTWGLALVERRGSNRATVAVARRLAVILHAMWKTETDFRWTPERG